MVASFVDDAKKKFVDGEDVTLKEAFGRAFFHGTVAAGGCLLGGAVSKGLKTDFQKTATASEKAVKEPISCLPNQTQVLPVKEVVVSLAEDAPKTLCAKAAEVFEKLRAEDVAEN